MDAISKWAQLLGRIALGAIFIISGLGKLAAWSGTAAYAGSKGVSVPLLAIATAFEVLGAVSVVLGFKARWGAVALLIFLVPVTLVFHNFWAVPAQQQQVEMVNFLKNLGIGGGLLIVLGRGAGAFSIDSRRAPDVALT
jgi:putative oxidoreductase